MYVSNDILINNAPENIYEQKTPLFETDKQDSFCFKAITLFSVLKSIDYDQRIPCIICTIIRMHSLYTGCLNEANRPQSNNTVFHLKSRTIVYL